MEKQAAPGLARWQSEEVLERHPQSFTRIRFQDCDPFGHLNNGRYMDYFINAREEHLRDFYGFDIYEGRFAEKNWVVRSSSVSHLAPARNNQRVLIRTSMLNFSKSSIVIEYVMLAQDESRILASAWSDFRYFEIPTGRPSRHETELLSFFQKVSLGIDFSFNDEKARLNALRAASAA